MSVLAIVLSAVVLGGMVRSILDNKEGRFTKTFEITARGLIGLALLITSTVWGVQDADGGFQVAGAFLADLGLLPMVLGIFLIIQGIADGHGTKHSGIGCLAFFSGLVFVAGFKGGSPLLVLVGIGSAFYSCFLYGDHMNKGSVNHY